MIFLGILYVCHSVFHGITYGFRVEHCIDTSNFRVLIFNFEKLGFPNRDSNSGPLVPQARILTTRPPICLAHLIWYYVVLYGVHTVRMIYGFHGIQYGSHSVFHGITYGFCIILMLQILSSHLENLWMSHLRVELRSFCVAGQDPNH